MNNRLNAEKSISFTINKNHYVKTESIGELGYREGFLDAQSQIFPRYRGDHEYMSGWFSGLGYLSGGANFFPCISEEAYLKGYEQGQQQRSLCSTEPDVRYAVAV